MEGLRIVVALVVVLVAAVAAIAAYSGAAGGDDTASPSPAAAGTTVAAMEIDGQGDVVVDSAGRALYAADQETDAGSVLCTEGCTSFWEPLTVSGEPTGSSVSGELGVVERPDGSQQVTLDGKLLYSFVEDAPGEVTGDGFEDAFDGQTLTWRVVHPDGSTGSGGDDSQTGPFDY